MKSIRQATLASMLTLLATLFVINPGQARAALLNDKHVAVVAIVENDSIVAVQSNPATIHYGQYGGWDNPTETGFTLGFAPGDPSILTITIDESYWTATGPADWIGNTTISFTAVLSPIGPGEDDIATVYIHLRAIPKSILVVKDGTAQLQLADISGNPLTMSAGGGELIFSSGDIKTVTKPLAASWDDADAEFALSITLSGDIDHISQSEFTTTPALPVRCLRQLVTDGGSTDLNGYTWFKHQDGGGGGINRTLPAHVDILVTAGGIISPTLNDNMGITGISTDPSDWTGLDDTTFTLEFGMVEISASNYLSTVTFAGSLDLNFRELDGAGGLSRYEFDVPSNTASCLLDATGQGTWTWKGIFKEAGDLDLVSSGMGPAPLLAEFQTPLVVGETGDFKGAIGRNDGIHPSSALPIHFVVTSAVAVFEHDLRASLRKASPNPFNAQTNLSFTLQRDQHVSLKVYDPGGRLVRTLIDGTVGTGSHSITWDGRTSGGACVASGVYLYRLQTSDRVEILHGALVK